MQTIHIYKTLLMYCDCGLFDFNVSKWIKSTMEIDFSDLHSTGQTVVLLILVNSLEYVDCETKPGRACSEYWSAVNICENICTHVCSVLSLIPPLKLIVLDPSFLRRQTRIKCPISGALVFHVQLTTLLIWLFGELLRLY